MFSSRNYKNKIIEKKIILKNKNKSLFQDSFIDKKKLNSKYPNSSSEINMIKIDEPNENELIEKLNQIPLYRYDNVEQFKKNILSEDENNNAFLKRNRNKNNNIINYNNNNNTNNLQTPRKLNLYQYNISTNTEKKSSNRNTYNAHSLITKNSTAEYTKKNEKVNNYIELNPISSLYEKYNRFSDYGINRQIKKINSITNFNEPPNMMDSNKLYYYNKIKTKNTSDFGESDNISEEITENINNEFDLKNNNTYYYFNLNNKDSPITRNSYHEKNKFEKENKNNNINMKINLNKKYSFINNTLYLCSNNKKKKNINNSKHIFVHRRRLSSFLINDKNNKSNNSSSEKETNITRSNYIYKREKKSFSCINLKEKINKERYNISKSKRKSKIIDLKNNNEFYSIGKEIHNGGKIDLFNNNKISSFKLSQESNNKNKEYDFKAINKNCLNEIIKIQNWFKLHIKVKKISLIQRVLRRHWYINNIKSSFNQNNNCEIKRPLINKYNSITKKYKNNKIIEKIKFIQNYFVRYLSKKNKIIKKLINSDCYISKKYKNKNDVNCVIFLQRKIRAYFKKNHMKIKVVNYYYNNEINMSSSVQNNLLNYRKYQKNNIPNNHQRNKDMCNFESNGNSSYNINNEEESINKKFSFNNKNDSINSININNQNPSKNTKCIEIINHKDDYKSIRSNNGSYKSIFKEEYNNENFHYIPKYGISKIYKCRKYNINFDCCSNERYTEDLSADNNNQNNIKDISLISPFLSLNNDNDNSNFIYLIKEVYVKNVHKKIIQELKIVYHRFYIIKFIMILIQRIFKSLNQYIFYNIIRSNNSKNNNMQKSIFFNILKRIISIKKNSFPKSIQRLIKKNIPLCLNKNRNSFFISYIRPENESNLIKKQLFLNNYYNLIDFILAFLNDEKKKIFNKKIINKYIQQNKLYNRNIFALVRYVDCLYEYLNDDKNNLKMNINDIIEPENNSKLKFNDIDKFEIISDSSSSSEDESININDNLEFKSNDKNNYKINRNYKIDSKFDNKCINNNGKKIRRRGGICKYENESNFWKDNDFFVSYKDNINRKTDCISKRIYNKNYP